MPIPQDPPKQELTLEEFEEKARERYGIPKPLWESIRAQESGGDSNAVSPTGVRGRWQVTQATAAKYGLNRDDPFQQAVAAAKNLREGYDRYQSKFGSDNQRWLAAAGYYYGGPDAVKDDGTFNTASKDGLSNPSDYVTSVAQRWKQYNDGQGGGAFAGAKAGAKMASTAGPAAQPPQPRPARRQLTEAERRRVLGAGDMTGEVLVPKRPGAAHIDANRKVPPANDPERQAAIDAYNAAPWYERRMANVNLGRQIGGQAVADTGHRLYDIVGGALSGDFRPLGEQAEGAWLGMKKTAKERARSAMERTGKGGILYRPDLNDALAPVAAPVNMLAGTVLNALDQTGVINGKETFSARPEDEALKALEQRRAQRLRNDPYTLGSIAEHQRLAEEEARQPGFGGAVTRGLVSGGIQSGPYIVASTLGGGPVTMGGLAGAESDWVYPEQARQNVTSAILPIAAGRGATPAINRAAAALPGKVLPAVTRAGGQIGIGAGTNIGTALARGERDPGKLAEEGIVGGALSGVDAFTAARGARPEAPTIAPEAPTTAPTAVGPLPEGVRIIRQGEQIPPRARGERHIPMDIAQADGSVESVLVVAPRRMNETQLRPQVEAALNPQAKQAQPAGNIVEETQASLEQAISEGRIQDAAVEMAAYRRAIKDQYDASLKAAKDNPAGRVAAARVFQQQTRLADNLQSVADNYGNLSASGRQGNQAQPVLTQEQLQASRIAEPTQPLAQPAQTGMLDRQPNGTIIAGPSSVEPRGLLGPARPIRPPAPAWPVRPNLPGSAPPGPANIPGAITRQLPGVERTVMAEDQPTGQFETGALPTPEQPAQRRTVQLQGQAPTPETGPLPALAPRRGEIEWGGQTAEIPRQPAGSPGQVRQTAEMARTQGQPAPMRQTVAIPREQPPQTGYGYDQEPTNRITTGEGDELPRGPQQALEGQPVELGRGRPQAPAVRPQSHLTRPGAQGGPPQPPLAGRMYGQFPSDRRAMTTEGRRVQGEIEAGRGEQGGYGRIAQGMFKSPEGGRPHGQDAFFHDPNVKGAVGLTRDAEMGDVRAAIKRDLARSMGVKADEISLTQVPPAAWMAWARQKRLGAEAVAKMRRAIEGYQQGALDAETTVNTSGESQQGQTKPRNTAAENGRKIQHSKFGEVTEAADQSGVRKGYLRIVGADGRSHVIKNPRVQGNREAAFIKGEPASAKANQPYKPTIPSGALPELRDPNAPPSPLKQKGAQPELRNFDYTIPDEAMPELQGRARPISRAIGSSAEDQGKVKVSDLGLTSKSPPTIPARARARQRNVNIDDITLGRDDLSKGRMFQVQEALKGGVKPEKKGVPLRQQVEPIILSPDPQRPGKWIVNGDGNHRVALLKLQGFKGEIPVKAYEGPQPRGKQGLSFGKLPGETKGGTTLGSLGGGLQGMFKGKPKTFQPKQAKGAEELTFRERAGRKIATAQTIAQLLNPKSIGQNIAGNAFFAGAKNAATYPAIAADKILSAFTKQRQVSTPELRTQVQDFMDGFTDVYHAVRSGDYSALNDNRYEISNERVFKNKVGGFFEDVMRLGLSGPDRGAFLSAYNDSVQQILKAHAKSKTKYSLDKIHEQAKLEAQEATFQDENMISRTVTGLRNALNHATPFGKKANYGLGDMVGLKYAKTPANLAARGIEYSPAGFLRAFYKAGKVLAGKGNTFDQREAALAFGKAFVGTLGGSGLGAALYSMGIITQPEQENRGLQAAERGEGLNGYQVNLSALKRYATGGLLAGNLDAGKKQSGDVLMSYDWLQPWAFSLGMGAAAMKSYEKRKVDADTFDDVLTQIDAATSTLTDQSILKNIRDLGKNGFRSAGRKILTDLPSSFVPAVLGQARQIIDDRAREVSHEKGGEGMLREALDKVLNRLPGGSSRLPERKDAVGRSVPSRMEGAAGALLATMPGRYSEYKPHPVLSAMQETGSGAPAVNRKTDEPEAQFKARRARAQEWLNQYGSRLTSSAAYQSAPPEVRKAAIDYLKTQITGQSDERRPKIYLLGAAHVMAAARERARKERREARRAAKGLQ